MQLATWSATGHSCDNLHFSFEQPLPSHMLGYSTSPLCLLKHAFLRLLAIVSDVLLFASAFAPFLGLKM